MKREFPWQFLALAAATVMFGASATGATAIRYAGTLAFSPDGTLFIGDNVTSAIYAVKPPAGEVTSAAIPLEVDKIDAKVANVLGVNPASITINGMAVHPDSHAVFLSVSRAVGKSAAPALMRVGLDGHVTNIDLSALKATSYQIPDPPAADAKFRDREKDWPVPGPEKYREKATTPVRTMTIVAMTFHAGELLVSGVSNEDFSSTLRRIPYPFTGHAAESKVRIYHVAHERYETRAPIRAMVVADVGGQDTLIAGYTCSPLVLIPMADLKDGAKVTGHTIGDMGNGQPLSMILFKSYGQDMLYVTNKAHAPRIIPLSGLAKALVYTPDNSPKNYPSDLSPEYPLGPVGKGVMFVGSSLYAAMLNDKFFVSLTRDADSGALILEALPQTPLPMRLDTIWSEFDFPGGGPPGQGG